MGEVKNISICIDIVELAELKQTNCEVLLKRERNGYASFSCDFDGSTERWGRYGNNNPYSNRRI